MSLKLNAELPTPLLAMMFICCMCDLVLSCRNSCEMSVVCSKRVSLVNILAMSIETLPLPMILTTDTLSRLTLCPILEL